MEKRVLRQAVLSILVLMLSSSAVSAATLYVRVDGSNNNTGLANSSGSAWGTIDLRPIMWRLATQCVCRQARMWK